jgi:EF hand
VRFRTRTKRLISASSYAVWMSAAPLALLAGLAGCSSGPAPLQMPSFDPADSASKAMELYDTDGDGYVAGEELEHAPGLKAALKNLDQNKDGKVSEEEIAERVRVWDRQHIGMMRFDCTFLLDGDPLADAQVTFDPDEFLLGVVQAARGETTMGGTLSPKVPKEKRATPDTPPGMQAGIYKVRVSKIVGGKETIPARYNTETVLGQEVSKDDWAILNRRVVFKLTSD